VDLIPHPEKSADRTHLNCARHLTAAVARHIR